MESDFFDDRFDEQAFEKSAFISDHDQKIYWSIYLKSIDGLDNPLVRQDMKGMGHFGKKLIQFLPVQQLFFR